MTRERRRFSTCTDTVCHIYSCEGFSPIHWGVLVLKQTFYVTERATALSSRVTREGHDVGRLHARLGRDQRRCAPVSNDVKHTGGLRYNVVC